MSRFVPAYPPGASLPRDVVVYGPEIPTESELKLLGTVDGKRVLDLGCGAGSAAVALAKHGAKVIAVDEASDQVAAARQAAEAAEVRLELHHAPLAELAFIRADTVDIAISVYGLAGTDDLDRVFRQVHRVLRPEANFVFSLPHPASAMLDPDDPNRVRRRYDDANPREWEQDGASGVDHPRTFAQLFTSLFRANFRVDHVLEPVPAGYGVQSSRLVPSTLIIRARKEGF